MDETTIQVGLPEHLRHEAAKIYFDAFRRKLNPILKSPETAVAVLQHDLDEQQAIVALHQDRLVGLVGIQHNNRHFIEIRQDTLIREFGWFSGRVRHALRLLLSRPYQTGELLMDGIAVTSEMRGYGIGTRLLNAAIEFAQKNAYQTIRLDVVDTNPDARRLYERMGFVATKTEYYGLLTRWMGFTGSTTMRFDL